MEPAPPSGRRGGWLVATKIGWFFLGASVLASALVTWQGIATAYQTTCSGPPPTAQRLTMTAIGFGVWLPFAAGSALLLRRGTTVGAGMGLLVACFATMIPFMTAVVYLFTIAMC
jgi:hypothetical protein